MARRMTPEKIGLPPRIFFFTVDQLSTMLEMTPDYIMKNMLFFEGRSPGICPKNKMRAQNLAPEGLTPEWRISEQSLVRYLKRNGVQFYTRGYA